jgi:hypothetical protein
MYTQFNNLHVEDHNIADITINNTPTSQTMPIQHHRVVQDHIPPQLHIGHVASILGYKIAEVPGDGNCMLHAINKTFSHQYPTHNKNLDPKKLRHDIHAHMHTPAGRTICAAYAVTVNELQNILPTSNTNGAYLEHWAIIALQNILKINITVYHLSVRSDSKLKVLKTTATNHNHMYNISILHHNNNHFSGLFPHQPP